MREIKFRAFDSKNEHMFYHDEEGNFDRCIEADRVGSDFSVTDLLYSPFECLTAMQFTGLKDKNGIEIYESDLILYQGCKGEVYYCNDTCMFMSKFKTTRSSWSFDSMDDEIEVIGNIHENPEL